MKFASIFFLFFFFVLSWLREAKAAQVRNNGLYIVYMGAAASPHGTLRYDHAQLLSSLSTRKKNAVVQSYKHGFSGFAARLTKEEAESIAREPGVVSVFPDPVLQLHTTRSWDFLKYQTDLETDSSSVSVSSNQSSGPESDTIIGILDTGIRPESESFNDNGMGPIPSRWKGTCMAGRNFTLSQCNRKVIGARYYNDPDNESGYYGTPRDSIGHGTHVASTAAGSPVNGASYYGLAAGTAKGGSPGSRIAVYRVCIPSGCLGSSIMAAFDDAIADGVDVLSLSLGPTSGGEEPDLSSDPIAIGAFHAAEKGITVVCSSGNDGPDEQTVVNDAPWILTVGATTIDRDFQSDVLLGGNKVIKGGGINFGNIQTSPVYPLVHGSAAMSRPDDDYQARNCEKGFLDGEKIRGKIVLCENTDDYPVDAKSDEVQSLGGIGVILIDDNARVVTTNHRDFPMAAVTTADGAEIASYINSTRTPVATILSTISVTKYKPAPVVAHYSSRGPSLGTKNLLKPDIVAPGTNILAAWLPDDRDVALPNKDPPLFNIASGTSMSCPHVSGIATTVKSRNPSWSSSTIKSAIMTTAIQTNNRKSPITTNSGAVATPYDYGAGEVSTTGSLQPGLVYKTETVDYLNFLCNKGYDASKIKIISSTISVGFSCPNSSNADLISNMNYPSIAISSFNWKESKKVIRTVTNVGDDETVYSATVETPKELEVQVVPNKLQFTKNGDKVTYEVTFRSRASSPLKGDMFGSITWINGKYKVRSPFVVSSS